MQVKIDDSSKFCDYYHILDYLADDDVKTLEERGKQQHGVKDFYDMTLGDMCDAVEGIDKVDGDLTLYEYFYRLSFKKFYEEFMEVVGRLSPPQDMKTRAAQKRCLDLTFREFVYNIVLNNFSISSFQDADAVRAGDIVILLKREYNRAVFEREYYKTINNNR